MAFSVHLPERIILLPPIAIEVIPRNAASAVSNVTLCPSAIFVSAVCNVGFQSANKFLRGSESVLEFVQRKLNGLETWNEESIDKVLKDAQTSLSLPTPKLNQPIRIAMTGSTQSPSLGLTLSLFDVAEVNHRINAALEYLANNSS